MKWLKQRGAEITIGAIAVAIGAGVYLYAHRNEGSLRTSKERGAVIVQALERHQREYGTYPDSLDALVPQYLPAVEPPTWGLQRWRYRRYTSADVNHAAPNDTTVYFQLSVAANERGYPVLFYDITTRRWVLNN